MEGRRPEKRPSPPPEESPPAKRPRRFFIEELFADEPWFQPTQNQQQQSGSGVPAAEKEPKDYVRKLDEEVEVIEKFNVVKVKTKFVIEDVSADPEALLAGIFQHCIDSALADNRQRGYEPDRLGCTIGSELLETDIWIPIREITENTLDTILNRFNEVVQSKKNQDVNLWGAPFTVCVTTVKRSDLPAKSSLKGGARRSLAPVHHRICAKSLIKIENNGQNNHCLFYALQATLVHNTRGWPSWKFNYYKNGRFGQRGAFEQDTNKLMRCVAAPPFMKEYDAEIWIPRVVDYWNNIQFVGRPKIKVFVFGATGHYKPLYKFGPDDYTIPILLYFDNKHFDGVIKEGGLFGMRYCLECERTFHKAAEHQKSCRARCILCGRVGPKHPCTPFAGFTKQCYGCEKTFTNNDCYRHHLTSKFCLRSKQCESCGEIWDVRDQAKKGRKGHVCDERFCYTCKNYHPKDRGCFIHPVEPKPVRPYRIVSFDFETTQHTPVDATSASKHHPRRQQNGKQDNKRLHKTNFVAARVACPDCISNGNWRKSMAEGACDVCGPYRTIVFHQWPFKDTEVDEKVHCSHPLCAFVDWILYELPKEYETVAFSHFGGRFDMVLVLKELFRRGFNPEMIRKGNKMFEMKVKGRRGSSNANVTFRDSFNLMPNSLSSLVPTFGLDITEKMFFPHMANNPENYDTLIFPTKEDYLANSMMPEKRKQFDAWYENNKHLPFRLEEALASYCTNDVDILMSALVAFRTEFIEVSKRQADEDGMVNRAASSKPHDGIDVLHDSMTISSASMRHYRANHLKANSLALIPERGYDNADNQSLLALKYLQWYAEKHAVKIQHTHTPEGEKVFGNFRVDGWVESLGRVIEINGCAWHGCPVCYPRDNQRLPNGKMAGKQRETDKQRIEFIRRQKGVKEVEIIWECEIRRQLEQNTRMSATFANYKDEGPLNIRDAFMGGRTGPRKLFHRVQPGQKISYYDVTSLYPFINHTTKYPVGHPIVHVLNEEVEWTRPEHNPYELALLKAFVVPPRQIDVAVLPVKVGHRLVFGTCFACAKEFPEGAVLPSYSCEHSDDERGWISTTTSIELNAALAEGYTVKKLYRVLEYTESDQDLFRPYISEFMSQKIHASGFSAEIKGCPEAEEQFIRECSEQFGIKVERSKMVQNKGKRALAKLALNNLWGRFSMRNFGLSQTHITSDPVELGEFLDDRTIEVTAIDGLTAETVLISYMKKKEWVEEHGCSNIVVSLWTTSMARLHLLKLMQKVVRSGAELLYTGM